MKQEPTYTLSVRVKPEMRDKLLARANRFQTSLNQEIVAACEAVLKADVERESGE